MRRIIVKIKGNNKGKIDCSVKGNAIEIMGAYAALTENMAQMFCDKGELGEKALSMLLQCVLENFEKKGIKTEKKKGKKTQEND